MRPVAWVTGHVWFTIRGYEVPSEPSGLSGTPGCFWRKLGLLLMHLTFCTFSSTCGANMPYSRPSSSYVVVARKVVCRSLGYFPRVRGNGQRWAHRNAAHSRRFSKSLCVRNSSQSGWGRPKSHCSKPGGSNLEVQGIEWAAPGLCTGCPT